LLTPNFLPSFKFLEILISLTELLDSKSSSAIIKVSTRFLLDRLDTRFPVSENMIVAGFLDPSMHKMNIISRYCREKEIDMTDLLVKKWIQYEPELNTTLSKQPHPSKPKESLSAVRKLRIELIQKYAGESTSEDGLENRIQQEYLTYSSVNDVVDDPLEWWKTHEAAFPYLSALARTILGIPSSSGATEHQFSDTGYFVNKKKANLDPLTMEMVMFVHDNFDYINLN